MSPERWQQINQLFHEALARPPTERAAFLVQACGVDEELRREVLTLLAADAKPAALVEEPLGAIAADLWSDLPNTAALPSSIIGTQLGTYQILHELGRGGMGEVYIAQDQKLGRRVALKLLPARLTGDPERVRRFQREARAASALNHPNILTIYDFGEEAGRYFIATEFVEGQTLRAALKHESLTATQALDIAIQVASALDAAHQAGIIHRDIKPENIMRRPDGYVKVLDFGLAKLTEPSSANSDEDGETRGSDLPASFETRSGVVLGTVNYMSPEQARGQKVDARTDQFSLGVVLYEMLTGHRPFEGATHNHTLVAILDEEPPSLAQHWPAAPAAWQDIISRALSKDRDERYPSAKELLAALKQLKDELAVEAQLERVKTSDESRPEAKDTTPSAVTTDPGAAHQTTGALSLLSRWRQHRLRVALTLVGALALVGAVVVGLSKWFGAGAHKQPFARRQIVRVAVPGTLEGGTISPDGKYILYLAYEKEWQRALWLKQVSGGGSTQIARITHKVWSLAISPNSNFVYYTTDEPDGVVLYQVPLLGGQPPRRLPAKIGILSNQDFSPDSKRVAVAEELAATREVALKLVTLMSGEQQTLASFSNATLEGRAWSPDDRTIAYIVRKFNDPSGKNFYIAERPVGGGPERVIVPAQRQPLRMLAWLPNRRGLLTQMRNETSGTYQIYFVSYADGTLRQITDDSDDYMKGHVTADGRMILAPRLDRLGNLQVAPLSNPHDAQSLTPGLNLLDTLAWTPGGQLIYNQLTESGNHLWRIAPGGIPQQLTSADGINHYPVASADGRYIVFASTQSGSEQLWRINADGSNPVQLTTAGGIRPQCSPDSQWVVYENGRRSQQSLWKISIAGGAPSQLTPPGTSNPAISPDGSQIACEYLDPATNQWRLAVMPFAGGAPSKIFAEATGNGALRWTHDGRALLWIQGHIGGYHKTLTLQPLDGSAPRTLLKLVDNSLYWFDLSPDGQQLAYISGKYAYNLLLIRDLD